MNQRLNWQFYRIEKSKMLNPRKKAETDTAVVKPSWERPLQMGNELSNNDIQKYS